MSLRRTICPVLAALSLSLVPASALAAPVTIGQMPSASPPPGCVNGFFDFAQSTVASGAEYVVPSGYSELTSWSTFAAEGAGQEIALKVFHPFGSLKYEARSDLRRPLTPGVVNTFPVEIHVAAGDVIGLDSRETSGAPNGCVFPTGNSGDLFAILNPGLDVGETGTFKLEPGGGRVNVVATLEAEPVINLVSPSTGPTSGGTAVVIAGHDLTGAKQVNFGSAFAEFSVESDNAIKAVSPAGAGTVDVTVTTAAGTSAKVSGDSFTYTPGSSGDSPGPLPTSRGILRCVVPKLKGKQLQGARRALNKAHCRLGKVSGIRGKPAKVKQQGAKAGASLPAGSKVSVKLGLP